MVKLGMSTEKVPQLKYLYQINVITVCCIRGHYI